MNNLFYRFEELEPLLIQWRKQHLKIVFTNGCFDLLHRGHIEYLAKAKSFGDILIIGLNSDKSVKILKGPTRPFINEEDRGVVLESLKFVDAVILFEEETPFNVINKIIPDVLVKGGDYNINNIVGKKTVEDNGGEVVTVEYIKGFSTSNLIEKIKRT